MNGRSTVLFVLLSVGWILSSSCVARLQIRQVLSLSTHTLEIGEEVVDGRYSGGPLVRGTGPYVAVYFASRQPLEQLVTDKNLTFLHCRVLACGPMGSEKEVSTDVFIPSVSERRDVLQRISLREHEVLYKIYVPSSLASVLDRSGLEPSRTVLRSLERLHPRPEYCIYIFGGSNYSGRVISAPIPVEDFAARTGGDGRLDEEAR